MCLFILGTVMLLALNFNLTGAGARATGMGGAFIGVADDATAIVWNPAGLTLLERPEASFVGRSISDKIIYDDNGDVFEITQGHFILNFLSGAYPFRTGNIKIVGAFAFQRQIDLYHYFKNDVYETEGIGGVDTATIGTGLSLLPFLSLGFSANLWFGKYTQEADYLRADYNYEESYSGFNFVMGGMLDLNGLDNPIPLKIGTVFRTPFKLTVDWKEEDTINYYQDDGSIEADFPSMIGFGASYRIGEFFTLASDYEMRLYSETDFSEFDLNQFRVGAEYLIVSDFAVIPIRAGFFTEPTTRHTGEDSDPYFVGDQIQGNGISLGSGLIFEKFSFDVSGSYSGYEVDWGNSEIETVGKVVIGLSGIIYFD